jgi:hypothetical protein
MGPEARFEMAAARLVCAVGYLANEDYFASVARRADDAVASREKFRLAGKQRACRSSERVSQG